jgi:hypothetical protein
MVPEAHAASGWAWPRPGLTAVPTGSR